MIEDGPVLVYCTCDHPRHGHAKRSRVRGRRSLSGETWRVEVRGECTMKLPDGSPCPCNAFTPKTERR